jgi:hypothetical protein
MVTADRAAPLRRVGSLLGLLGLEVAAVAGLHRLGRLPALRIPWERPLPWLLDSPVQNVLGSLLRMVVLVMAYWLLASTVLYLLASLSHLPAAVRAVGWLTLPLVRRVADHAVAVTLATSMVGGGTLASAGPAVAAPGRDGGAGPPARRPVAAAPAPAPAPRPWAAAQPTTTGQDAPAPPSYKPRPAGQEPTTTGQGAPSRPRYIPRPAGQEPSAAQPAPPATEPETSEPPTTEPPTTRPTTSETTTTAAPTTTPPTTSAPTTTRPEADQGAGGPGTNEPGTNEPGGGGPTTAPAATTTTGAGGGTTTTAGDGTTTTAGDGTTTRAGGGTTSTAAGSQGRAAGQATTSTSRLRPPAYQFNPAGTTTTTRPEAGQGPGEPGQGEPGQGEPGQGEPGQGEPGQPGSGSKSGSSGGEQATSHRVVRGDNLWTIARDHLAEARGRSAAELSDREIAVYWLAVQEANRGGLRSGDFDLIYPGEEVELPQVPAS